MVDRLKTELPLIELQFGEIEIGPNLDWVIVKRWNLVQGWNKDQTKLLIQIPPGYAVTPPDNFYTDNDLRLADGAQPGNSSTDQTVLGSAWLLFSYHIEPSDWQPKADPLHGHNLVTYLHGVDRRLREIS